jgi:complement component 1 Q subcomponent-binding protein
MQSYLEKRGFNTLMATFIPDYIDVKEQKEYLSWLGRIKDFVE